MPRPMMILAGGRQTGTAGVPELRAKRLIGGSPVRRDSGNAEDSAWTLCPHRLVELFQGLVYVGNVRKGHHSQSTL